MNYVQVIRESIVAEIARTCPDWDIAATPDLLDSYALLVLSVGENVTRELVHDAWSLWSNRIGPTHRYLVPFADLSPAVQARDEIGRAAIATVARARSVSSTAKSAYTVTYQASNGARASGLFYATDEQDAHRQVRDELDRNPGLKVVLFNGQPVD